MTPQHPGEPAFTYRAVAVIVDQNRVLLHRAAQDAFWSLPGARVDFLELAAEALKRDMQELLEAEVSIDRLLWVVENFITHRGKHHHNLGLYFLANLPPQTIRLYQQEPSDLHELHLHEAQQKTTFCWFPREVATLHRLIIRPNFL
jgi:ADP-ribose pyrophosphatase YjhB (NUDIX family)